MDKIEITPELLTILKALAQKATPEFIREGSFIYGPKHPASKHPNGRILIADIIEGSNQRDPHLAGGTGICSGENDAAYIAAANPAIVLALIEKIEILEKEADWLAKQLAKFDVIPCPEHPCSRSERDDCLQCWRRAARKAVEAQCKSN